jgi:F-type H+-transporting ATPase subunit b
MLNEKFWLAIAFFSFVTLVIKYFGPKISKILDDKSKSIAQDIISAKEARKKAEELLVLAQEIHQESIANAEKLISQADSESKNLLQNAQELIDQEIARMTLLASQRIKIEEEASIREIKTKILYSALAQLQDKSSLNPDEHNKIIDKSIKNFERIH